MKVHVFVATTKGVVAIQKIYAQDPDIRSVVSLNGTASVSPISGAYHYFVKKGVGIIEQDFGSASYRINISAAIDQGNSWQLGFYLAHAAHAQNCLGDGNPQVGDSVVIASGELNTSERKVLAVAQLASKIQQVIEQIKEWPKGIELQFLLPEANSYEVARLVQTYQQQLQILAVDSLQQALLVLPASKNTATNIELDSNSLKPRFHFSLPITIVAVFVLVAVGVGIYRAGILNVAQHEQLTLELTQPEILALITPSFERVITLPNSDPTKISAATSQGHLQLAYSDNTTCQEGDWDYQELESEEGVFADASYQQLCDINLTLILPSAAVIAVNRVSHRFVVASKQAGSFHIKVPSGPTEYLLLVFSQALQVEARRTLHTYLFDLPAEQTISKEQLQQFAQVSGLNFSVFSHRLLP